MASGRVRHFWLPLVLFVLAVSSAGAVPAQASQLDLGEELVSFGEFGSGAGQLKLEGGGIAADPTSGHLFISDFKNNRISEFTAWGEFVKAWGWGVDTDVSALQTCTAVSSCAAGQEGSQAGQMNVPNGVALGPTGDLYVFERENLRVQVFNQAGEFVRMFGGGVNGTDGTDICTAADLAAGDACGKGEGGTGPSEFSVETFFATQFDYIDISAVGAVYVGDKDRIQVFQADGSYVKSLPLPLARNPWTLDFDDSSGDLYVSLAPEGFLFEPTAAYRLEGETGSVVGDPLPTTMVEALSTDPEGTLFAADGPFAGNSMLLRELNSSGEIGNSCCEVEEALNLTTNVVTGAGGVDLYATHGRRTREVSFVEVRGPAPDKWPPPSAPPTIESQFASEIEETSATLKARINPNFWADTEYWVEYGTAPCSDDGCGEETAKTPLGSGIVKKSITTGGVELSGLAADTTYHFRFVAESGGGGPSYGIDPDGPKGPEEATFADGLEGTFTTSAPAVVPQPGGCPANEAFRTGPSANLWECRAYELVSPVDKLGGDILVVGNINGTPSRLDQATPEGDKVTYSSYRSFGDAESAAFSTQYIASRDEGSGWSTRAISPPREGRVFTGPRGLDSQFKAFSEDLSFGWLVFDTSPILAPGGVPDYPNLYRRDNSAETYAAMSTTKPTPTGASDFNFEVQGASADSTHTVFRANGKITTTASNQQIYQVYENVSGTLRLVSVKPTVGGPIAVETTVGSYGSSFKNGREANAAHAVSEDGLKIYFTEVGGSGKLYVRVNGTTTTQVSSAAATYWNATPDGEEALYTEAGNLKLFDLASKTSTTLAEGGVGGVMGASADLNRVYFVSTADLAGDAEAGKPNLYLYEEGQPLTFIATVAGEDALLIPGATSALSPVSLSPRTRVARVSPDGQVAIFASRGELTGEDNLDQASGEPSAEVFRYDAASDELACLSCLGNGARPQARQLKLDNAIGNYYYASLIPGWEFLHATRALSDDGARAYFNSLNRLVPQDQNGMQDVYEWEAPGRGDCTEAAANYRPASEGCVNLISTGTSTKDSEFIDASTDGRDVFFTTDLSLVSSDPGQFDLYDARIGGGFAPPAIEKDPCSDESQCLPNPTPAPPAPGVGDSQGPSSGNVKPKPKCRKGFVRKHGKCVKKHKKHKHKAAKNKKGSK